MQLLILVLMLMSLGKNADFKQIKPLIESFGGNDAAEALKQAEELSGVITAMQSLAPEKSADKEQTSPPDGCVKASPSGFPLSPVVSLADEKITYALSRFVATGN